MNKAELIAAVVKQTGVTNKDAKAVMDALFNTERGLIVKSLKKGDKVTLTGFGSFERRARNARKARNPQTGDTIKIRAKKVPAFKAGASFKEAVR